MVDTVVVDRLKVDDNAAVNDATDDTTDDVAPADEVLKPGILYK